MKEWLLCANAVDVQVKINIPLSARSHNNRAFMIESHTSTRPHFVQIAKNGKVICDDCPAYKSAKLCAHVVAAAEKAGILKEYISWLNKSGPSAMNLTSFVTFDSAKGTGKKDRKSSTARRKGGRNSKVPPVDTYVDRPFKKRGTVGSTVNTTSTVTSTYTQSTCLVQQSVCIRPQTQPVPPLVHPCTSHRATTPMQPSQIQQSPMQPSRTQPSKIQSSPMQPSPMQPPPIQPSPMQPSPIQPSPMQPSSMQPSSMQPVVFQQNVSTTPTPVSGTFELHLLRYCPPLVRVCFGCCQTLKPGHSTPNPPNDMTVVSRMQRIFILPTSEERVSREGNVYFHLHVNCIRTKQPFFQPNMVVVPQWVANLLSAQHKILLREFGICI